LSGAYSPNLNNPPYFVDFPLDSMGNWIDAVWNRWMLHNNALLARNITQQSDLAIFFDCGMQDEYLAYRFNTGFADSLDELGIAYEFQSYTGGHSSHFRYPIGFKFLDSVMNKAATNVDDGKISGTPTEFILYQNYPNPFNPSTVISYQLAVGSRVTLKVYDILGNEVATLVNEEKPAGSYEVKWSAESLSSGVYFYQLIAGSYLETKKMILLR
jgi:hypothetical protein